MGRRSALASDGPTASESPLMRRLVAPLAALALVALLGGCSSDGSDGADEPATTTAAESTEAGPSTTAADGTTTTEGDEPAEGDADDYAAALAVGLTANAGEEGELDVTDEEAACVAPAWVDIIGVDAFVETGTAPAELEESNFVFADLELDDEQGLAMIDAFDDCDVDVLTQIRDVLSADLDATQAACLDTELDDDLARQFLAEALTKSDLSSDLADILDGIDQACGLSAG